MLRYKKNDSMNDEFYVTTLEDEGKDSRSSPDGENLIAFKPLLFITESIGIFSIILVLIWIFEYSGGLEFYTSYVFNWHPLFMSIGMVYLMGNALLTYRGLRNLPKAQLKLIHATLHGVIFILALLATIAAYKLHIKWRRPHLCTIHSWVGTVTLISFIAQSGVGFVAFLISGFRNSLKILLLPYHVFFGHFIFAMAILTAISGINEKTSQRLQWNYFKLEPQVLLLNLVGILFIIFGLLVTYLTTRIQYKRSPTRS